MTLLPTLLTTLVNSFLPKRNNNNNVPSYKWQDAITMVPDQVKMRAVTTGLTKEKVDQLAAKITALMEVEKLYQETELNLNQLAMKLEVPAYQVSITINEKMKRNFNELINEYRVEEAKRLLLNEKNRNYTILSVGFEAGFNSKTTFNTVFKKFTGLTPTEYRDKQTAIRA